MPSPPKITMLRLKVAARVSGFELLRFILRFLGAGSCGALKRQVMHVHTGQQGRRAVGTVAHKRQLSICTKKRRLLARFLIWFTSAKILRMMFHVLDDFAQSEDPVESPDDFKMSSLVIRTPSRNLDLQAAHFQVFLPSLRSSSAMMSHARRFRHGARRTSEILDRP